MQRSFNKVNCPWNKNKKKTLSKLRVNQFHYHMVAPSAQVLSNPPPQKLPLFPGSSSQSLQDKPCFSSIQQRRFSSAFIDGESAASVFFRCISFSCSHLSLFLTNPDRKERALCSASLFHPFHGVFRPFWACRAPQTGPKSSFQRTSADFFPISMVLRRPRLAPYNHQPPPVLSASSVHRFSSTSCWFRLRFINSILDHCIRCLLGLVSPRIAFENALID